VPAIHPTWLARSSVFTPSLPLSSTVCSTTLPLSSTVCSTISLISKSESASPHFVYPHLNLCFQSPLHTCFNGGQSTDQCRRGRVQLSFAVPDTILRTSTLTCAPFSNGSSAAYVHPHPRIFDLLHPHSHIFDLPHRLFWPFIDRLRSVPCHFKH
jgi:hypothetical protein